MQTVFLKILNMSLAAGWLIPVVILLRFLLKKAPKAFRCVLWSLVGIRLVFPFSIKSVLSLIPSAEPVPQDIIYSETPEIHSGIYALNSTVNPVISESLAPKVGASVNPMQVVILVASVIWIIGVALMIAYGVISCFNIQRKVGASILLKDNIYVCDSIETPFIFGVIKPRIYLPSDISKQEMVYVVAHENAHLKRLDYLWKPLGFVLLSVYWFNPLIWFAYIFLCRDIELACDERVIKDMEIDKIKEYSVALLNCSILRKTVMSCPLAFGEVGVKNRIKSVLNYKKPAFWIVIIAIVACAAVSIAFLTDPVNKDDDVNIEGIEVIENSSELEGLSLEVNSVTLSGVSPNIEIKWNNETNQDLMCGDSFVIYRLVNGVWQDCDLLDNKVFFSIGYLIPANGNFEKKYNLQFTDMTNPGKYRFESTCSINKAKADDFRVWIDFELKSGAAFKSVHQFEVSEIIYDNGSFSFVPSVENTPSYRLVDGMNLQQKYVGSDSWSRLGHMTEITLEKSNFDLRFINSEIWYNGYSSNEIRKNNKRAWQIHVDTDGLNELYIFFGAGKRRFLYCIRLLRSG